MSAVWGRVSGLMSFGEEGRSLGCGLRTSWIGLDQLFICLVESLSSCELESLRWNFGKEADFLLPY